MKATTSSDSICCLLKRENKSEIQDVTVMSFIKVLLDAFAIVVVVIVVISSSSSSKSSSTLLFSSSSTYTDVGTIACRANINNNKHQALQRRTEQNSSPKAPRKRVS
uniref:Uncharacterized protein n=1 Tax=Glossina austeni TaxID=7395 RepID=A0A1A9VTW7_GLOAU